MKIVHWREIVNDGYDPSSLAKVRQDIKDAIHCVVWPVGSGVFRIYPQSGKNRGEGNGVKPIKTAFISHLVSRGWVPEHETFDAHYSFPGGSPAPFAVEWETGNVSSSHRAINRMARGMVEGRISGGVLVLPTRNLAQYLTDRIGNAEELEGYEPLWARWMDLGGAVPYLGLVGIEHDATDPSVPRIPKGTDGRAAT